MITVTFDAQGGLPIPAPQDVDTGDRVIQPEDPQKTGYIFVEWLNAGIPYDFNYEITDSDTDFTLTAHYDLITYSATYNLAGGTNNPANPETFTSQNLPIILQPPSRLDYDFTGWFADSAYTEPITEIHDIGSRTLYAKWALHRYYINYYLAGGINDPANPSRFSVVDLPILSLNPATKDYFTFNGWFLDSALTIPFDGIDTGTHNNFDVYAKFTAIPYQINYEIGGGVNNPNNPTAYTVNAPEIILGDAARTGYTFSGWFADAQYTNQIASIPTGSHGDITLYAKWQAINYQITYIGVYNGTHSNPGAYTIADTVILGDAARTGYTFSGWFADPALLQQIYEIPLGSTGLVVLHAKWEKITYQISYSLNGGTQNSQNITSYDIETPLKELRPPTRTGYAFQGWYKEADFSGTPISSIAGGEVGNIGLFARWNINVYPISYELYGQGENSPENPTQYTFEDELEIKPPFLSGHNAKWYNNPQFEGQFITQIPRNSTGAITLYAKWEIAEYTIYYNLEGGKNNDTNPKSYNMYTPAIELLPAARTGYTFSGWFADPAFRGSPRTTIGGGELGSVMLYAYWTRPFYPDNKIVVKDIYEGDPRIEISNDGADLNYINGNPRMEKGLQNEILISLFTKEGWCGNVFLSENIGCNLQDLCQGDISVQKLALIESAVLAALQNRHISAIDIQATNPNGNVVKIVINITPSETINITLDDSNNTINLESNNAN
ncbi:MAG: hypothetical protein Pg6A_20240 [Termitinemataceae bacterium]|nr:MAG: hypothetical protein Pg6A_20240 [Termitinemataceae bacterium]